MDEIEQKLLEKIASIGELLSENNSLVIRFDNFEKKVEGEIQGLLKDINEYKMFISKTSGFFTRIGFYLDGIVFYLKTRLGKK